MPEGLSAAEVGKEIGAHAKHSGGHEGLAAWFRLLGGEVGHRIVARARRGVGDAHEGQPGVPGVAHLPRGRRDHLQRLVRRYLAEDAEAVEVAERRFRPEFRVAFDPWIATDPFQNPDAPAGPQVMPEYVPTGLADSERLDDEADALFEEGHEAAETADNYVRTTVILASVLFLVGISTQFPLRSVRYGLIAVGAGLLIFAVVLVILLPPPP